MKHINRYGWLIVMLVTLSTSAYSLFYVARHLGAPVFIAIAASVVFDWIALLCANYSLDDVKDGETGLKARLYVYAFAGISAYINSMHAVIDHEPGFARLFWAIPPIGAVVIYELHTSREHRRALARSGRNTALGFKQWVRHPRRAWDISGAISNERLNRKAAVHAPGSFISLTSQFGDTANGVYETGQGSFVSIDADNQVVSISSIEIRKWAKLAGLSAGERGPLPAGIVEAYYQAKAIETQSETNSTDTERADNE